MVVGVLGAGSAPAAAATVPAVPSSPNLWAADANGVEVHWLDGSTNEDTFVVQRSRAFENASDPWTTVAVVADHRSGQPGSAYQYNESTRIDHDPLYTYCVRVGARNTAGTSYTETVRTVSTDDCSAARPPTEAPPFTIANIRSRSMQLQINRTRAFEWTYFVTYRRAGSTTLVTAAALLPTTPWSAGSTISVTVGGLQPWTGYCFEVTPFNPRGDGPAMPEQCRTTLDDSCRFCLAPVRTNATVDAVRGASAVKL